jgi:hypothetical protein
MHVKRIRAPFSGSRATEPPSVVSEWPQVAAELADREDHVESLTAHRRQRASSAGVRLARRAARREAHRLLRDHRAGLGLCESCRRAPAEQRLAFANRAIFAVCSGCARDSVTGVAA